MPGPSGPSADPRDRMPLHLFNRPTFPLVTIPTLVFISFFPFQIPKTSIPPNPFKMARQFFVGGNFKMYVTPSTLPRDAQDAPPEHAKHLGAAKLTLQTQERCEGEHHQHCQEPERRQARLHH